MKSEGNIRGMIRHRAKHMLLEGKSDMVKFAYDGNKLYAIYEHDGQREAFEVQIELLANNRLLPVVENCPTRMMDGRNEIRCWYTAGHDGPCK